MSDPNEQSITVLAATPVVTPPPVDEFDTRARAYLSPQEFEILKQYKDAGKMPLSPQAASGMFGLFLTGNSTKEIHNLNRSFPHPAILWARISNRWDEEKSNYIDELQQKVREKLLLIHMESVSLISDVLAVASKKHGSKLKKYLQTGQESDLGDAMTVDSVAALSKAVEVLQKITGDDRTFRIKTDDPPAAAAPIGIVSSTGLSSESAARILAIVAEEKRKKGLEKNTK